MSEAPSVVNPAPRAPRTERMIILNCPRCLQPIHAADDPSKDVSCPRCSLVIRLFLTPTAAADFRGRPAPSPPLAAVTSVAEAPKRLPFVDNERVLKSFVAKEDLEEGGPEAPGTAPAADRATRRLGLWVAAAVATAALVSLALMDSRGTQVAPESSPTSRLVERVFSARTWEDWLPVAAQPEQAREKLAAFYQDGFRPPRLAGPWPREELERASFAWIKCDAGRLPFAVIPTSEGLKFDWERLVDLPRREWREFLDERPRNPRRLRVYARRAEPLPWERERLGDRALAAKVYFEDPNRALYCVMPKSLADGAHRVEDALRMDQGVEAVLSLHFPTYRDGELAVDGLTQWGWTPGCSKLSYESIERLPPLPAALAEPFPVKGSAWVGAARGAGEDAWMPAEAEAKAHWARFLAARDPEEKLRWIIDPARLKKELRNYYAAGGQDWAIPIDQWRFPPGALSERDIQRGVMTLVAWDQRRGRHAPTFWKDGKLDWESYIQVKDDLYGRFMARPREDAQAELRVRFRRRPAAAHEGAGQIVAWVEDLAPGGNAAPIQVSAARTSALGMMLESNLSWESDRTATARVGWSKSGQGWQVRIDKLICWDLRGVGGDLP